MPFSKFKTDAMTKIISQIKPAPHFVMDNYFAKKTPSLSDSVDIKIKKGSGLVLSAVSKNAEHTLTDSGDVFVIKAGIPRFPLKGTINAAEVNELKTLNSIDNQIESVAKLIAAIHTEHRASFDTTYEFMALGALFGKVLDGGGKALFEFATTDEPIKFNGSKTFIDTLGEIEDAISEDVGVSANYRLLVSNSLFAKLASKAEKANLFKTGLAIYKRVSNLRAIEVCGVEILPYVAKYTNTNGAIKDFLSGDTGIAVPNVPDMFELFYTSANHIEALGSAPSLYFSAQPEKLSDGRGYSIISESRGLPVCVRPTAIKKIGFED